MANQKSILLKPYRIWGVGNLKLAILVQLCMHTSVWKKDTETWNSILSFDLSGLFVCDFDRMLPESWCGLFTCKLCVITTYSSWGSCEDQFIQYISCLDLSGKASIIVSTQTLHQRIFLASCFMYLPLILVLTLLSWLKQKLSYFILSDK